MRHDTIGRTALCAGRTCTDRVTHIRRHQDLQNTINICNNRAKKNPTTTHLRHPPSPLNTNPSIPIRRHSRTPHHIHQLLVRLKPRIRHVPLRRRRRPRIRQQRQHPWFLDGEVVRGCDEELGFGGEEGGVGGCCGASGGVELGDVFDEGFVCCVA